MIERVQTIYPSLTHPVHATLITGCPPMKTGICQVSRSNFLFCEMILSFKMFRYQFKGLLAENYVLQQLRGQFEVEPHYYSDKNSEIDFILQFGTEIIPVEAKGGEDKSAPSFKKYIADNKPEHAPLFKARLPKRWIYYKFAAISCKENERAAIKTSGHIIGENSKMMCPIFLPFGGLQIKKSVLY